MFVGDSSWQGTQALGFITFTLPRMPHIGSWFQKTAYIQPWPTRGNAKTAIERNPIR